jgi:hypothetical protein
VEIRIVAFIYNEFVDLIIFLVSGMIDSKLEPLENQLFYPIPLCGSQLIFFAPLGAGVNEENQFNYVFHSRQSLLYVIVLETFI